jgi:hypothetical protein
VRLPLFHTVFAAAFAVTGALPSSALPDTAVPVDQPSPATHPAASTPSVAPAPSVELNLRQLGAIGDNQPHPVREWIAQKKYKNLRDIQRDYPFVTSLDWSIDETVFQRALRDLPPEGGTIRIPAGRYVATAYGWRIDRNNVRLSGAGMRDTMLSAGPKLDAGLVLAPAAGEGWELGVDKEYPFAPDTGTAGSYTLRLREPARAAELKPGDLVFIRSGAARFAQDCGEFNEIVGTTPTGDLLLKHPLSRDCTLAALVAAGETAEALTIPKPGKTLTVSLRTGEGFAPPPSTGAFTVGESLFEIVRSSATSVTLRNPGRGNPVPGTVLPAGTKIAQSRAVIRVTRTTRSFTASGLRVFGHRTALDISNSYETSFTDCDFVRQPLAAAPEGPILGACGGRFAAFLRCAFRTQQPSPTRIARSFGDIAFTGCTFVGTSIALSDFSFAVALTDCNIQTPSTLGASFRFSRAGGDLRVEDSRIVITGGTLTVFEADETVSPPPTARPARLILRDNRITGPGTLRPTVFRIGRAPVADISGNTLNNAPVEPPPANSAP